MRHRRGVDFSFLENRRPRRRRPLLSSTIYFGLELVDRGRHRNPVRASGSGWTNSGRRRRGTALLFWNAVGTYE